jgi:hypothetical protein
VIRGAPFESLLPFPTEFMLPEDSGFENAQFAIFAVPLFFWFANLGN